MCAREKLTVMALCALLGAGGACAKKDDAGRPSSVPPLDPGAAPAPPAPSPPTTTPPAPPVPTSAPAPAEPRADDPGASITGSIVVTPAVAKARPKGGAGTLYLVARRISDNPTARGTLIAVRKLPATTFPLPFSLTAADMPFQNGPFDGDLTLTARIDQDGDPLTHEKGDVFGTLPKVHVGSHDVKLALDQVQKETESLAGAGPGQGQMPGSGALPPGHP